MAHTEQSIGDEILAGLVADNGGESQISSAEWIPAQVIASDVCVIQTIIRTNQKSRSKPNVPEP